MSENSDRDRTPPIEVRPGVSPTRSVGADFGQISRRPPPASPIVAEAVPLPLPARSRIAWRVATLALCLQQCRGQSATVMQLHILTWAIQSQSNFDALKRHWLGRASGETLRIWNPDLEDALRIASAAHLIDQKTNGRQSLTPEGLLLAQQLDASDGEAMLIEREFLSELGKISTAGMMRRLNGLAVGEATER